jgi:hypothetical protein
VRDGSGLLSFCSLSPLSLSLFIYSHAVATNQKALREATQESLVKLIASETPHVACSAARALGVLCGGGLPAAEIVGELRKFDNMLQSDDRRLRRAAVEALRMLTQNGAVTTGVSDLCDSVNAS